MQERMYTKPLGHSVLWKKVITCPVQLAFPLWGLHSGWQATHSPSRPANSLGALGTRYSKEIELDKLNSTHISNNITYLLTQCENYSCPHMCRLGCSSYRRHTGRAPGPSTLSLNTAGHTHGPLQLHKHGRKTSGNWRRKCMWNSFFRPQYM